MDELIDVVDEDDRVVGRATRHEMRTRNLLHRAVYLLLFDGRGHVFVHRRTDTKDVFPGHWDVTLGGVVAAGEDYASAARRELAEEVGVAGVAITSLGAFRYEDAGTRVHGWVYAAVYDGPLALQEEEIATGSFVTLADAARLLDERRCCPDGAEVFRAWAARAAATLAE